MWIRYGTNYGTIVGTTYAKAFQNLSSKSNIDDKNINIAKGLIYNSFAKNWDSNYPERFVEAIKKLKNNEDIYLTKADKCNSIVILDKITYM